MFFFCLKKTSQQHRGERYSSRSPDPDAADDSALSLLREISYKNIFVCRYLKSMYLVKQLHFNQFSLAQALKFFSYLNVTVGLDHGGQCA